MTLSAGDSLSGIDPAASKVIFTDSVNQPRRRILPDPRLGHVAQRGLHREHHRPPRVGDRHLEDQRRARRLGRQRAQSMTSAELIAAGYPGTFENVAPDGT